VHWRGEFVIEIVRLEPLAERSAVVRHQAYPFHHQVLELPLPAVFLQPVGDLNRRFAVL
jgi:hypothetical protein